jgi:hypothetical protein
MTTSAKHALNAARAAQAAATRHKFSRTDWPSRPSGTKVIGKTASGAEIRVIDSPVKFPKGTAAGNPQHVENWPNPTKPNAKPKPEFCVTTNGKPLHPKLAELIRARLKPIDVRCAEVKRLEDKLTGPQTKPSDWPGAVPFYPGCTFDPGIAKVVAAAEARDAR